MFDGILRAITRPGQFFQTLQQDDGVAARALLVVLLVAVLNTGVGYFSALPTARAFAGTLLGSVTPVTAPLTAALLSFLSWLVYGLLVRVAAGTTAKPWAITAYAMSPQAIIYPLIIAAALVFPVEVTPIAADVTQLEAAQEATLQVQREVQASTFGRASQVLNLAAILWWLALIFVGVRAAAGVTRAFVSVALVAALSLGLVFVPLLLTPL